MPSEKRRKRRRIEAERSFDHEQARAATFGLELVKHDVAQYSLAWPTGGARWELYPTTQKVYVNREKKQVTPALPISSIAGNNHWTLATIVDAAVKVLGLKHVAPIAPVIDPAGDFDGALDMISELSGGPTAAELERLYRDARDGLAQRLADDDATRNDIADDLSLLAHNIETTISVIRASLERHYEHAREIEKRIRTTRAG